MSGLAWFKLYPKDLRADAHVAAMSAAAFGAYMRLLCSHWELGHLPTDERWLARTVGMPLAPFRRIWPQIRPCFELTEDGHAWVQKRMLQELEKVRMKADKNRLHGAKGGRPRNHGGSKTKTDTKKPEAKKKKTPPTPPRGEPLCFPEVLDGAPGFREEWAAFEKHRKEKRAPLTTVAVQRTLAKLERMGPERAVRALTYSISQGYTGVFEDPEQPAVDRNMLEIERILNPGGGNGSTRSDRDHEAGPPAVVRVRGARKALGEGIRPPANGRAGGGSPALPAHREGAAVDRLLPGCD